MKYKFTIHPVAVQEAAVEFAILMLMNNTEGKVTKSDVVNAVEFVLFPSGGRLSMRGIEASMCVSKVMKRLIERGTLIWVPGKSISLKRG